MVEDPEIVVRPLRPDEAGRLVDCIRRCYGDSYSAPELYDADEVRALLTSGELESIGAFTEDGQLVGHMAIRRRADASTSADAGTTLVDPAWRGLGLARRVAVGLGKRAVELGLAGMHDYPVTVHAATQRLGVEVASYTGMMLASVPADVVFEEMADTASGERSHTLIRWLAVGAVPARTVHLPARHRAVIEGLYRTLGLDRESLPSEMGAGPARSTLGIVDEARRKLRRIRALELGRDFVDVIAGVMAPDEAVPIEIVHLDLPLADPRAPWASEAVRALGFSFAGLLPEYRDGDVLRLQWLRPGVLPGTEGVLSGAGSRAIADYVLADHIAVGGVAPDSDPPSV